jgi:hypothetical protein
MPYAPLLNLTCLKDPLLFKIFRKKRAKNNRCFQNIWGGQRGFTALAGPFYCLDTKFGGQQLEKGLAVPGMDDKGSKHGIRK